MRVRYSESWPGTVDRTLAIQPWGALEWHGEHLPLGLDGLVAEWFASALCDSVGGTLLPTQWNPMTTLPHPLSLQISTGLFRGLVTETIEGLFRAGFLQVAIVSGHYAQGHMVELYSLAQELSQQHQRPVLVATPLELLGEDGLLDHAGRCETSQLISIHPELVRSEHYPSELAPHQNAVLGGLPLGSSAEEGQELLEKGIQTWTQWIKSTRSVQDLDALYDHYNRAISSYDAYRQSFYRESWEQAITDWWATKAPQ